MVSSSRKRSSAGPTRVACAVGDQVVDVEAAIGARRDHGAQVGRRVAQQVGERLARWRRQPVGLVDDQDDVERRLRDLGEPDRHAFEAGRRRRLEQGVAERRPAGARRGPPAPGSARSAPASSLGCADSQATTRPCARCSRRHCASSEVLPKPAGACTRMTGWSRRRSSVDLQARPGDLVARHARRRDLQQQVVGHAFGVSRRKSRHGFQALSGRAASRVDGKAPDGRPVAMVASGRGAVVTSWTVRRAVAEA